jgi:hypothetical protein
MPKPKPAAPVVAARALASPRPARTRRPQPATRGQKLALAVGGVGCFMLLLSVWECTVALNHLTGLPLLLACLLAVGVDVGLVLTCVGSVVAETPEAKSWCNVYVKVAILLSVALNAAAAAAHADGLMKLVAVPVGGLVPVLIYVSERVAGTLWVGK